MKRDAARKIASVCAAASALASLALAQRGVTVKVSWNADGSDSQLTSFESDISHDGRYVAFASNATGLVAGVPVASGSFNVFVRDLRDGVTTLVTPGLSGAGGNAFSRRPRISDDGRIVAFESLASDLIAGDTNGVSDVFVRDRQSGVTQRLSVSSTGAQLTQASYGPDLSADGRFVAFYSASSAIVVGDGNALNDVFVRDLQTNVSKLASLDWQGLQMPSGVTPETPSISGDGRYVAFSTVDSAHPLDTNTDLDVYVRDLVAATTVLVSQSSGGAAGNSGSILPSISADGRWVAFESFAHNLDPAQPSSVEPGIFVRDVARARTRWVAQPLMGMVGFTRPSLSADGRRLAVVVASHARLFDLSSPVVEMLDETLDGQPPNASSSEPVISGDGRFVTFHSVASNLVAGDVAGNHETYVRDWQPPPAASYCTAKTNSLGCAASIAASGAPSLGSGSAFDVFATHVLNQRNGVLFYGFAASAAPFQGGTLCVSPPLQRTALSSSGGNALPANDCSGALHFDFNARIRAHVDPALAPGVQVSCQYWSRDPAASFGTNLSNALSFEIRY